MISSFVADNERTEILKRQKDGIAAAGAILYYLEFTEHREISHIKSISRIDQKDYVWIDKFTIRNLELFSSNAQREKSGFVDVIDRTLTAMGGRMLRRWVALPLLSVERIAQRQNVVPCEYNCL